MAVSAGSRQMHRDWMAMRQKLRRLASGAANEFGRALYFETEIEATECQRRVPVDTGTLKSTIHAEGPFVRGRAVSTQIVAGGPAAPYALIVHEDLEAIHPSGQAKYIESTLMESAPFMLARVVRRVDLQRVVGT